MTTQPEFTAGSVWARHGSDEHTAEVRHTSGAEIHVKADTQADAEALQERILAALNGGPDIKQLRAQGYAVSIWNPDELDGRDPTEMEDHLGRTGNEFLEFD